MSTTKQIPRAEWKSYFDRFTRQQLADEEPEAVTIEVVSPQAGDQFAAHAIPLLGLSYDPRGQAFEVLTDAVEHLAFEPTDIWVVEEAEGFISTIALTRSDGTKELLYLRRAAAPRYEQPPAP